MAKQLTVHNATINTAAVEVKTLSISGKQVTLAVFRQLRDEQLIADDGTVNGQPWGFVNYHPDKCDGARAHKHYVWQRGDELLRSRVYDVPDFDPQADRRRLPTDFRPDEADRFLDGLVREWINGAVEEAPLTREKYHSRHIGERSLGHMFGFRVMAFASDAAVEAADKKLQADQQRAGLAEKLRKASEPLGRFETAESRESELSRQRESAAKADSELAAALANLDAELDAWGMTYDMLKDELTAAAKAESDRRQRHRDARTELNKLPQLFIAV
ncbi:hypothetical protein ABT093_01140 [Kitasatospora sp. NPDC002551]|uniref:hypothetical protein n=1 Tax=Kitasatospora sp. NPDC002551 TaxID=3154539 RepID=UPI003333279C